MFDKLKMVEKRYNDLNDLLSDPKIIAQQSEFQKYAKEQSDLTPIVNRFQDLQKYVKQLEENKKFLEEEKIVDIPNAETKKATYIGFLVYLKIPVVIIFFVCIKGAGDSLLE